MARQTVLFLASMWVGLFITIEPGRTGFSVSDSFVNASRDIAAIPAPI